MNRVSAYLRLARTAVGAAAAFALLTGAAACNVVDRPIRVDHVMSDPCPCTLPICRPGCVQR